VIRIEVMVSSVCPRCEGAVRIVQHLAREVGSDRVAWRRIDVLEEIDYAVELGVLATPAIIVDGVLTFTAAPSAKALRKVIEKRMTEKSGEQRAEGRQR